MSRPDFSTRGRRPDVKAGDLVYLAFAALALCLSLASAAGAWGDLRRATADLDKTRHETEAVSRVAWARQAGDAPDAVLSARALLTAEAPPPRVLADLEALLPGDVRLMTLNLEYGERLELVMQLAARQPASYDRFLRDLQQSPLFADVRPGEETRDGGVRAQIKAAYRGGRR
jgi:Tfp pilus assembly protein PilN